MNRDTDPARVLEARAVRLLLHGGEFGAVTGRSEVRRLPDGSIVGTPAGVGDLLARGVSGKRPRCLDCGTVLLPWVSRCWCGGLVVVPAAKHRGSETEPVGRHRGDTNGRSMW